MTGVIATIPRIQFSNALGVPLAGGKLITYLAGSTTPEPTYQDQALTIENPTSITLDATGSCVLWMDPAKAYKFVLKNKLGVTEPGWPVDNINGAGNQGSLSTMFATRADLASAAGSNMVGFTTGAGAGTTVQAALRAELANVNLFFVPGEADSTDMFNRATAAARKVYVPAGTYNLNAAEWPTDTEIFGDGHSTILYVKAESRCAFLVNSPSPSVSTNVQNLYMHDLQIRGEVDAAGVGFAEHSHLLNLNGVTNVLLERLLIKGFRGDGVYFGSHSDGGQERHNERVVVRDCVFDGINRDNRNAISFIDIDGCLIDGCHFANCTRPNMPGPIDFEPNPNPYHIIRNAVVRRCTFANNGGNVAEVAFYVPAAVAQEPRNILVEGCTSDAYQGTGQFFLYTMGRASSATSGVTDIRLRGIHARNGNRPFQVGNGRRVLVQDSSFTDMKNEALIGAGGETGRVYDMAIEQTRFERCGAVSGKGLTIFNADYLALLNSKFIDCGAGTAAAANAVVFNTGTSSYVSFVRVEFSSPTGKTQIAIQKEAAHTFDAATNRFMQSSHDGLSNNFQAVESDTLLQGYAPVVTGSTTAGAGAYTLQQGRYRRIGKTIFFTAKVSVSAGHTGTGMIQVSLPTTAAGGDEVLVNAMLTGVASTGGHGGLVNPALVVGGVGAVRCYHTKDGASLGQTVIPAGAFTVYCSGSYPI